MSLNIHIDEIFRRYDVIRYNNEQRLLERTRQAYEKIPEIKKTDDEIAAIRSRLFKAAQDIESASSLQNKIDGLLDKKRALLKKNGFDETFLDPIFNCGICKDTGYNKQSNGRCICFTNALMNEKYKEFNIDDDNASFENFNVFLFPEEKLGNGMSQRESICVIKKSCEEFANGYPAAANKNILFFGHSGLGKTYLLKCILKRLIERGRSCLYIPAYKLFDVFYKYHLGEAESIDDFYNVPVLIIDDLGTEPLIKNVTSEYFFYLVNERLNKKNPTLFATNLSLSNLKDRYGERIISRMFFNNAEIYEFKGKDIRVFADKKWKSAQV